MDFSCEYNAPQFVDFDSINAEDDSLAEKYFEIDHENKSIDPMMQVDHELDSKPKSIPKIVLTPSSDEEGICDEAMEREPPRKRMNNLVNSWAHLNKQSKRLISLSKKVSKDTSSSDRKSSMAKTLPGKMEFNGQKQQSSSSKSKRRSSGGGKLSFVSSKVVKHSRRSSSGTGANSNNINNNTEKENKTILASRLQHVLKTGDKPTGSKPLKGNSVSAFKLNKMIQSYQDAKQSKAKDFKTIRGRVSEFFFRPNRDSSVGAVAAKELDRSSSYYVPMAEQIMKMENKVPDRYRTLPSRGRSTKPNFPRSRSNSSVPRATICKSPRLLTKEKSRECSHAKTSSHEVLPSPKPKRPQRKVSSSESVDRLQGACCGPKIKTTPTQVQPFSFDQKIAEVETRKANRIKEILEKEKQEREFKATSAPNFMKPINLPIRELICPTIVEPFQLESRLEARSKKREENSKKMVKEVIKFKARPARTEQTFAPAPSVKPPVEIVAFELHSDRRAQEREIFERRKREKEMELQEHEARILERKRNEELEEIRKLRQEATIKSKPIPSFPSPKLPRHSSKPMTLTRSPKLTTKLRSLNK